MPQPELTDEVLQMSVNVYELAGSQVAAATALGMSRPTFQHRLKEASRRGIEPNVENALKGELEQVMNKVNGLKPAEESIELEHDGDSGEIKAVLPRAATVADAIRESGLDPAVWEVTRPVVKRYEGYIKNDEGQPEIVPMTSIKAPFKRREFLSGRELVTQLIEDMGHNPPRWRRKKKPVKSDKCMVALSVPDLHIGKYAWREETGDDYDSDIASQLYHQAIDGLLASIDHKNIGQIVLPIGNDLLHVDNVENTTTSGTRQDVDSRIHRSFRMASRMLNSSIDRLSHIAPVKVVVVPGNHDRQRCYYLGEVVSWAFDKHPNVDVDNGPKLRKFIHWNQNMIMWTHGCDEKEASLESIMMNEQTDMFAGSTRRECHIGHFHKKRVVKYTAADTHGGVIVRTLPSLSGTDAWHYRKGYVSSPRAAQALMYTPDGREVCTYEWRPPADAYKKDG